MILFISCQTKQKTDQNNELVDADTVISSDRVIENVEADSITAEENFDTSDCIRGQAEPILKRDRFPDSFFEINEDGLSGTETTYLESGDKLIITNGGCEYYVLVFRFETSRFQGDTTDINFWASNIVDLMTEINNGIDSPMDLKKGTIALSNYVRENQVEILDEVTFEPGEIRTYLTIDRVQKIDNKKYGLEISYIVGPL